MKAGRDFSTIDGTKSSVLFCALLRGRFIILCRAEFRYIEGAFNNHELTLRRVGA